MCETNEEKKIAKERQTKRREKTEQQQGGTEGVRSGEAEQENEGQEKKKKKRRRRKQRAKWKRQRGRKGQRRMAGTAGSHKQGASISVAILMVSPRSCITHKGDQLSAGLLEILSTVKSMPVSCAQNRQLNRIQGVYLQRRVLIFCAWSSLKMQDL